MNVFLGFWVFSKVIWHTYLVLKSVYFKFSTFSKQIIQLSCQISRNGSNSRSNLNFWFVMIFFPVEHGFLKVQIGLYPCFPAYAYNNKHLKSLDTAAFEIQKIRTLQYLDRNSNLWREKQNTAILTSRLDDFIKNEILKSHNIVFTL